MKKIMNLKNFILTILLLTNITVVASHHHDHPSVHGMLLFGEHKLYLSHLPMFHNPHDYQIVFETEIEDEYKDIYLELKKKHGSIFTIVPEVFSLPKMIIEGNSFKASLYQGHFERGGLEVLKDIKFIVKKILVYKKFKKDALKPLQAHYFLIGNKVEQFLIHEVFSKPDFDQILEVNFNDEQLIKELSKKSIKVILDHHNANPLVENKYYNAHHNTYIDHQLKLETIEMIYLEFGDLSF